MTLRFSKHSAVCVRRVIRVIGSPRVFRCTSRRVRPVRFVSAPGRRLTDGVKIPRTRLVNGVVPDDRRESSSFPVSAPGRFVSRLKINGRPAGYLCTARNAAAHGRNRRAVRLPRSRYQLVTRSMLFTAPPFTAVCLQLLPS